MPPTTVEYLGSSRLEKSPWRQAIGMMVVAETLGGDARRKPRESAKKNSLSFLIGPPKVPPNWFQRIGERKFWPTVQLRAQLLAFSLSLRKVSNRLPWNWLVPDFRT